MTTHQKHDPPKWATRFFRWFCNDHLADAVLGDMLELHERRAKTIGKKKADFLFVWNVIQFLQPFALRNRTAQTQINKLAMLENYLKISWRTMSRQKMYTAIKIGGFAIGLATCIMIALLIRHELSYDKYLVNGESIYRVYNGDNDGKWTAFPASMASIIKADYPEIEKSARLIPFSGWWLAGSNLVHTDKNPENIYQEGFAYADQDLLEILQVPMVYGKQDDALSKPYSIVLSRRMAEKFFPGENPVGQVLILNEDKEHPYTIGGVMENPSPTFHLHKYEYLVTLAEVEFWKGEQASWCCWNYNVYVQLRPGTNPRELEEKMLQVRDKHYVAHLLENGNQGAEEVRKHHRFYLQNVSEIHLYSNDVNDDIPHGDMRYVWLFGGIACFILLLACINFINLSTAKSANRAKEVGLRKVVGSMRSLVIRQFLTESTIYSLISFVLALLLVWMAMPLFNTIAGLTLIIPWTEWWFLPVLFVAALFIGLIAGIYPSFYLSAFKPIDVLKGSVSRGMKGSKLRAAMVVFQFTTSIILIIGTFVIYRQMNFVLNSKLGFDKEQVILIQGANTLEKRQTEFKDEVMKLAGVDHATLSAYFPVAYGKRDQNGFWQDGRSKIDMGIGAQRWYVDEDYISTLGIKLVEGRNFNPEIKSDSQAIIINKKMAKELNLTNPVGSKIMNWQTWNVIGVVEDFHFESMKGDIGSLALVYGKWGNIVAVKVSSDDMPAMISSLTTIWDKFMPNQPFRYTFLDDSYAQLYEDVQRMGYIFGSFAILAIIVACLGLFALSAFMVEQRNKEISIRLVMGASVQNIFRLLTQNFVGLVLISFTLAAPLGWYMMNKWLQDYKYKTEISWDVFVLSAVIAVSIALLTVSYQSVRAALANPAKSLRSE